MQHNRFVLGETVFFMPFADKNNSIFQPACKQIYMLYLSEKREISAK